MSRLPFLPRRAALGLAGAAALPRFAIGQSDTRPSITVAVQKISNSNTLEPLREQSNPGQRVFSLYGETLIDIDWLGSLGLQPRLAESWRRIDDRTLEMTLRQGVKFHNGATMTVEDVAFTFSQERMWTGATAGQPAFLTSNTAGANTKLPPQEVPVMARSSFPAFERIEIVNAHTVRFVNKTPDPTLEGRMTRNTATIYSQRAWNEAPSWLDWARKTIATGPYRIRDYRPDVELVFEAHDEYWGGRPPLKTIRLIEVPETSSRTNGLLAGDYDFACDLPPDQIGTIDRSTRHHVVGGPIANIRLTAFDKHHAVLANPLVRRAMSHSVDRKAIVDALWYGRTNVPEGLQWPFFGPMLLADYKGPEFDLKLAADLLKQAGYKGEEIPYQSLNNYYTNQTATAQVLTEGWRLAGLNVVIEMKENFGQVLAPGPRRGICDNSVSAWFPDPVSALALYGPGGQVWQTGQWKNDEAATTLTALQTEMDLAKRRVLYRRMLTLTEREDPAYIMLHQNGTFTGKRRDTGWKAAASFVMDFRATNWARG